MPDLDVLEQHRQARVGLADRMERLRRLAEKADEPRLAQRIQDEERRCRSAEFVVAVAGEFSTGKSTLINALLGAEELPTDATECTQVLTRLRAAGGERPEGTFVRLGTGVERAVEPSVLGDLLRTADASLDGEHVLEGEIRRSGLDWLDQGVSLVDTPGISGGVRSEQATLAFLPTADALLFVTRADRLLRASEVAFLREQVPSSIRDRILLLVNAADRLGSDQDRLDVRSRVTSELGEAIPPERVHFVSARTARSAHRDDDSEALASSGIPTLKDAVATFLAYERGAAALDHHARILRHLSEELEQALRIRAADLALDDDLRAQRIERVTQLIEMARTDGATLEKNARDQMQSALSGGTRTVVGNQADLLRQDLKRLNKTEGDVHRASVERVVQRAGRRATERVLTSAQDAANRVHATIAKELVSLFDRLDEDLGVQNVVALEGVDFSTLVQLRTVEHEELVTEQGRGTGQVFDAEDMDQRIKGVAVGATIGAVLGGPLGAVIGAALGGAFGGKEEHSLTHQALKKFRRERADVSAIESGFRGQLEHASRGVVEALVNWTVSDVKRIVRSKVRELEERLDRLQADRSGGAQVERTKIESWLEELERLRPAALPS